APQRPREAQPRLLSRDAPVPHARGRRAPQRARRPAPRRRRALDRPHARRGAPHRAPYLLRPAAREHRARGRAPRGGDHHRARLRARVAPGRRLPARAAGAAARRRRRAEPPAALSAAGGRVNEALTLEAARARDARDVLRPFRARFALPADAHGEPLPYLCGHSLGLMPLRARALVDEELEDWARLGVEGHEHARRPWIPYHEQLTAGLAALTGARAGEVIAMNSLTVNLHLMLASFYRPQGERTRIVMEAGAFPSDRHAVTSQIAWWGRDPASELVELAPRAGEDTLDVEALEEYLEEHGERVALVLWPPLQYRTGQAFDAARLVHAAHRHGCVAGLDLAHAIGNLPLALHDADADF